MSSKINAQRKGSTNERKLCNLFSLWWSDGKRDDIFWRTPGSGARARVRTDNKKDTGFGYGDMQAQDPSGQPLIDAFTFEFKVGYTSQLSFLDFLDSKKIRPTLFTFLKEVEKDAKDAKTIPLLIIRRDRKEHVILMPATLYVYITADHLEFKNIPDIQLYTPGLEYDYTAFSLKALFTYISPEDLIRESKELHD